jgi:hypothetical protein
MVLSEVLPMPIPPRQQDKTVNPEIERLLYQVKVILQEAEGLIQGIDDRQFNWRPPGGGWSMAQCFDHLNVSNRQFLPVLRQRVEHGRRDGRLHDGPYSYSFLSRWMFRSISPPVKRKFRAPKSFRPAEAKAMQAVLEEWRTSHDEIAKLLNEASGLDLAGIKAPSPVTKLLRYNLGMAFWIMTAHDRRHLAQARDVRNAAGFPPASTTAA